MKTEEAKEFFNKEGFKEFSLTEISLVLKLKRKEARKVLKELIKEGFLERLRSRTNSLPIYERGNVVWFYRKVIKTDLSRTYSGGNR